MCFKFKKSACTIGCPLSIMFCNMKRKKRKTDPIINTNIDDVINNDTDDVYEEGLYIFWAN